MAKRGMAFGRALRSRARQSFVASITLVALLAVTVFALVIGRVVAGQIEDQALDRARETAGIVARSSFAPRLPRDGAKLARADRADLDRQLAAARGQEPGLRMRLWGAGGTLIYGGGSAPGDAPREAAGGRAGSAPGDAPREAAGGRAGSAPGDPPREAAGGRGGSAPHAPPPAVRAALGGRPASDVDRDGATDTSADASLTAAVPVRRSPGAPVAAAVELTLPYAPIGRDIRDRTRRLYAALLIAALIAYALALPALIRAGRAVRAQYDPRRVALMRELRRAMRNGELAVHYHPIADSRTGEVHTAEALLRWHHPERGVIAPDRFIPLIEPTELMWPLTVHTFELVVRQARAWADAGVQVRTAVNVSSADIIDPRLPGELERLLREHGVDAGRLEIEVTEGAVMSSPGAALDVLGRLTGQGIGVLAIDDFGTGYSSLARLHELPLDELKIDQSFVMRMAREGDETMVRSIVELGHALGFRVIAEGVEDEETWRRLAGLGVDYVQGYVMTRPLPAGEFTDWLLTRAEPAPSGAL